MQQAASSDPGDAVSARGPDDRISRRKSLLTLLAMVAIPLRGHAQQPARIYRVGYLSAGSESGTRQLFRGFVTGMKELGYVEGRNVMYYPRWSDSRPERIPKYLKELSDLPVDVIMGTSEVGHVAARTQGMKVPIVTVIASDPVAEGLVQSLSHPGGNITGIANVNAELDGKRFELLHDAVPGIRNVAVMLQPHASGAISQLDTVQRASQTAGTRMHVLKVHRSDDIEGAFAAMRDAGDEALLVMEGPVNYPHRKRIVKLATVARLPAIYGYIDCADEGGLMAYSANLASLHREAARHVDRILKGAKPGELPIAQATRFELVVNLRATKILGITLPQSLLLRADRVIE